VFAAKVKVKWIYIAHSRDFEGEDVKILCSDPPKGTTLREYAPDGVSRVKIGSTA